MDRKSCIRRLITSTDVFKHMLVSKHFFPGSVRIASKPNACNIMEIFPFIKKGGGGGVKGFVHEAQHTMSG